MANQVYATIGSNPLVRNFFSTTDKEFIFKQAYDAFVPDKEDNIDCIPYYRCWAGIRAVIGEVHIKKYNNFIHNSMFWARAHTWTELVKAMQINIPDMTPGDCPREYYCYDAKPCQDVELIARSIFEQQFRDAFPRKRLNSKFAKEQWVKVQDKAREFAREDIARAMKPYNDKLARLEREYKADLKSYINKCHALASWENFVRSLTV